MAKKKTHEEFVSQVFELVGNEYTVLGKYEKGHQKINFQHNKCGGIYEVRPSAFLYGARCSHCLRPEKKTKKQFEMEVQKLEGEKYSVLSEYKGNKDKVLFRHNVCGYEYEVMPIHFLFSGRRCPRCNGGKFKDRPNFKEEVTQYSNGEYTALEDYKGYNNHVLMKHITCGHEWLIKPANFFNGKGCPICCESVGEREIRKILTESNIEFESQFKFPDCKNVKPLPFDFAILVDNKVAGIIEFHGKQHFKEVDFFGGKEGFQKRVKNDKIKKNYCQIKNIPFLEIHYNENIESELDVFLNKLC